MNVIEFKSVNKEIVFCIVDYTSIISHDWTREIIKNLSDFVLSNIVDKGYTVLQGVNEEALLEQAVAKNYKHAVVLATGTEFINGRACFDAIEQAVQKDYFLQGHIPDRNDGYYQLHEQCYIINLEIYNEIGKPEIGKFSYYDEHKQVIPLRSEENIHDDYTPLWVAPGRETKIYTHKWHGWNIISLALENDLPILVFDEAIRKNKKYYYPDYEPAFRQAQEYLYGKQVVSNQALFYPFNTEKATVFDIQRIDQLVVQASGLNWVDYLVQNDYNEKTVVNFVDNNIFALECMQIIVNWDGKDYPTLIKEYITDRCKFLDINIQERIAIPFRSLDNLWEEFLTLHPNWIEQWTDIKSKVTFKFTHADLVLNASLPVSNWLENKPNTVIHLSHIFNYDPVAPFVPLRLRIENENSLISKIATYLPEAFVVFQRRSANTFLKDDLDNASKAGNMSTIKFNNLIYPTWHMNGDWQ